jgi:hypothetical protein
MRSKFKLVQVGALLMTVALTGCVVATHGGAYDGHSGYSDSYRGGAYSATTIHRHGKAHPVYPAPKPGRRTSSHRTDSARHGLRSKAGRNSARRVAGDLRDWRDGDGAFRRKQRALSGVGLEKRQRLGRQERLLEGRQDNADRSRARRSSGQVTIPGSSDPGISEKFDQDVGRRMQRSTQAERRAQQRASEVRRQLRATRQAEKK